MTVNPEDARPLRRGDVDLDPFGQFSAWFDEATALVRMAEAVALATTTLDGAPSIRMVLMKHFDRRGFVFYTNYESRKGTELTTNPRCAMLFYWDPLGRQVRIEGEAERVPPSESDQYFSTRPRGAQLGAHASRQSDVVSDRAELDRRQHQEEQHFDGQPVPRPPWWGGFRLRPVTFEFWQNRADRLHDRLRYRRQDGDEWLIERLQP
jgi:pyridoxamine 5'-phosphate oxidase